MWQTLKQRNRSQAEQLASLLEEADAVVVGIGAGMSAADGFTYIGPRFENVFPDFIAKYAFWICCKLVCFILKVQRSTGPSRVALWH